MIAQLAVAAAVYAIDKPYSYRVPEGMQVQPGLRVLVPFGRGNRRSEAVVLALQDTAQRDLKVIERALDDAPILSQAQLQLAAFMKERYFCTFYEAVKAILPAGFWFAEKKTLTLAPGAQDKLPPGMANSDAARLVQLLQEFGGSAPERTLRQQFSSPQVFDTAVQQLLRRKLLRSDAELTQKTGGKTVKIAALAVSAEEAEQFAAEDKKQREAADIRNQADQMVFQTEKTLEDMGDKIPASDRNSVESALNHLKETQKGSDVEAIKAATEELTKAFYAVSEKLYQQNGGQAGPGPDMGGANFGGQAGGSGAGPDVVDADYEVVDDDKK